ncbi:flippase-like domain-containing protein [Candidatus Parcubacteria bacterium]|nr:flippase-like domain-containing protein [Patescibacteria group bacterium]MBU4481997.1 flippase-like domain-containing protein [Patescibacteria group bacterium]MCG2686734.1 flippase-like domain-containing protein [Candidatus Parcubacteria bacterium]
MNFYKNKKLFFPILLLIAIIIVLFKFSELREIGQLFKQAKWYWLVLALLSQWLNFSLQANVYRASFKILKMPQMSFLKFIRIGITVIFLNFTIPSLGFAGNIWFLKKLKKQGIKEGKALLVVVIEFLCYYATFFLLLILSLVYLFFKLGHVGYTQKIAVIGFGLITCLVVYILYFFVGQKKRAHKRVVWLAEKIDKAEDGIRQEERIKELLNDFYENFTWLKKNKTKLLRPALMQFLKFLSDGLTIFLIFLAFGSLVPIGLGVVAFAFGRLFGVLSFIPGGVGAFDAAMVLIFNSLGVSFELALSVMLIYRLFSFWIYFPLGLFFYKQFDKQKSSPPFQGGAGGG